MGPDNRWGELVTLLRSEDWTSAIKYIDRIIAAEPENPNHYLKKGDICLKAGNGPEALGSYLRAAWHLNRNGSLRKALAVYKIALQLDPDNDEARHSSTKILTKLEAPARASTNRTKTPVTELPSFGTVAETEGPGGSHPPAYIHPLKEPIFEPDDLVAQQRATTSGPCAEKGLISELLSSFSETELEEILGRAVMKSFSDGETVVCEGDKGESMYIIKKGNASVLGHFSGKEITLAILSDGDLFGEVAFLTNRARTADVVAKGDLDVYELDASLLDELVTRRPEFLNQINEIYITRVRHTIKKVKAQ